jgi:DNA polymerase-3 subunit gamma/tau
MASQALYLKWRPQRFEDVVGQEHVTTTLRNALRAGRISHAYLFSGPRGTGKTTMARLLAKAVNCLEADVNSRPCNVCHICRSINEGRLLDLIEMDAASHTGVDNVREAIRDKVGFRPTEARYKVYVIDEVHMLSTSAFNALLKTLEEPPEHVIFCLATTEPHKVLTTILSRCQHFEFHRIPLTALVARLRHIADQEGLAVDRDALHLIARMSTGSARDAISLLDQLTAYGDEVVTLDRVRAVLGLGDEEAIYELLACVGRRDIGSGLDVVNRVVEQGADLRQFAQQVVEHLRAILLLHIGGEGVLPDLEGDARGQLGELAEGFTTHDLVRAIKLFNQAQLELRASDQNQLALELAFVETVLEEQPTPSGIAETSPAALTPSPERDSRPQVVAERRSSRSARPPPAPPRGSPTVTGGATDGVEAVAHAKGEAQGARTAEAVSVDEIESHWSEIRGSIRAESRQVEALVNSSTIRGVEQQDRLVLEFASQLLADKLGKEENRRIVERALGEVLGKRCRVRGAVKDATSESSPVFEVPKAERGPAGEKEYEAMPETEEVAPEVLDPPVPDRYQAAEADPVVQDLVSRGGQITAVQLLSEDDVEEE